MTRVPFLLTALFTAVALAGCFGGGSGGGDTALSLLDEAQAAADGVADDPVWYSAFAGEWTNETFGQNFEGETPEAEALNQGTDDDPGDGHANAWGFLFFSGEQPVLVVVASGGEVLEAATIPADSETAESYGDTAPLADVQVDSDEAAQAAADSNETFARIRGADDAVVVSALAQDGDQDRPYWVFTAFTESEEEFVFVLIDARTGDAVEFPQFGGQG